MDFLKKAKVLILFAFIILVISQINARSSTDVGPDEDLRKAFKDSYAFEKNELYNNAIDVLKGVYDEKNYEINLRLGWLNYLYKQYDESVKYYDIASKLMPFSIESRFGIVNPLVAQEKWDKVAEQYTAIIIIDPQNTIANYRLGLGYYYKADYANAYKYFEKVYNLYPFDYNSILMLAWSDYQLGKPKDAEILFKKVLLLNPDDASAKEGLALLNKK
jgi:tetratricopeptide (TPR) repeat protein